MYIIFVVYTYFLLHIIYIFNFATNKQPYERFPSKVLTFQKKERARLNMCTNFQDYENFKNKFKIIFVWESYT